MADDNDDTKAMKIALLVTSAASAWLAQRILTALWKKVTGHEAPKDPVNNDSSIAAVVAFAAVGGATAALSRILAARGAKKFVGKAPDLSPPGA
jgi:hypothetical protein